MSDQPKPTTDEMSHDEIWQMDSKLYSKTCQQLRSQLAAELDKRTNLAAFLDGSERKLAELRRTQTTLMDALKLIAWSSEMILPSKVAKEALAKVKEGK